VREIIARLVIDHMAQTGFTKTEMAARMYTSGQALARLLDPDGAGLTLDTLERVASAVGKKVRISFDDVAA
jgi:antitoxin HicB